MHEIHTLATPLCCAPVQQAFFKAFFQLTNMPFWFLSRTHPCMRMFLTTSSLTIGSVVLKTPETHVQLMTAGPVAGDDADIAGVYGSVEVPLPFLTLLAGNQDELTSGRRLSQSAASASASASSTNAAVAVASASAAATGAAVAASAAAAAVGGCCQSPLLPELCLRASCRARASHVLHVSF